MPNSSRDEAIRDAEARGMIAGALAAGETTTRAAAALPNGGDARRALAASADESLAALRTRRFALPAALLDETLPLAGRTELLAVFTRGFLSGLGSAGERLLALDANAVEMLRAAPAEGSAADPEEERAYRELAEYLRLAAEYFYRALA